jgi:4-aminobutyrate aminotransferase-like enzyme
MRNALELEKIGREILTPLVEKYEQVGDVRQYGAWAAVEFVKDKASQSPSREAQHEFSQAALMRGVFAISAPEKWVYRMQPALTMQPELFRWSCEQMVEAAADVFTD